MFTSLRPSSAIEAAKSGALVTRPALLNEAYVPAGVPNPMARSEGLLVPGSIYRAFTGIGMPEQLMPLQLVMRPTLAAFHQMGLVIHRAEFDGAHRELVVYFSVDRQSPFVRGDFLFEFVVLGNAVGATERPVLQDATSLSAPGFQASQGVNKRLVEAQPQRVATQAVASAEARAKAWLNGSDSGRVVEEPVAPVTAPVPLNTPPPLI